MFSGQKYDPTAMYQNFWQLKIAMHDQTLLPYRPQKLGNTRTGIFLPLCSLPKTGHTADGESEPN
jgi:hypothetical protein